MRKITSSHPHRLASSVVGLFLLAFAGVAGAAQSPDQAAAPSGVVQDTGPRLHFVTPSGVHVDAAYSAGTPEDKVRARGSVVGEEIWADFCWDGRCGPADLYEIDMILTDSVDCRGYISPKDLPSGQIVGRNKYAWDGSYACSWWGDPPQSRGVVDLEAARY